MKQNNSNSKRSTHQSTVKRPTTSEERFLTHEEEARLLGALAKGLGHGFTEAEGIKVLEWADQIRLGQSFLQLALDGLFSIAFAPDGQLQFAAIPPENMDELALKRFLEIGGKEAANLHTGPK